MSIESTLFGIALIELFLAMILFIVFGQVTMRKLRKNPKTKNELGLELASGWDILNVAGSLFWPKWLNKKLKNTPLSSLYADADILNKHVNLFDKLLAKVFYFFWATSILIIMTLAILSGFGAFD